MKSKIIFYIAACVNLFCWTSCVSDPDLPSDIINAKIPEVKTIQIEEKTATTITISAEVLKENGMPVTEYGVYWSKGAAIDTTKAQSLSAGKGKGVFTVKIEGLDNNSEYYVAPYAKNKKGIGLGETEIVNTADGLGTVTTLEPQNVTATTADLGGKIGLPGEGAILERGVYLSLNPKAEKPDTIILSEMDRDSFICHITKLDPNTIYYAKAFVKNNFGVFTGDEKSFNTRSGSPVVGGLTKVEIGFYDATFKAEVIDEGDAPVIERGFCYKIEDGELPTIENDTIISGAGIGAFEGKLINLSAQVQYRVRAFAKNEFGVSYSTKDTIFAVKSDYPLVRIEPTVTFGEGTAEINATVLDEGQSAVYESGFWWSATNAMPDSTDNVTPLSAGKTSFSGILENLRGNTTYYVRAYAKNSRKTAVSESVTIFKTPPIYTEVTPLNNDRTQGTTSFFYTKEEGYLLGGRTDAYLNELWRYNLTQDNWTRVQAYPETDVSGQAAVLAGREAYVFGGKKATSDTYAYINDFYEYDTYNNLWTKIDDAPNAPDPLAFAVGCNLGQSAYYIGGLREDSVCSEVNQYNIADHEWMVRTNLPEAQYGGIALVVGNKIFAGLGVRDRAGTINNKKLWSSQITDNEWTTCASIPTEASKIIGGVTFEGQIYVVDNTGQLWMYSPANDLWSKKTRLSVLNDHVHCIYQFENKIYIGLGHGTGTFVAYNPHWDN